MLRVHRHGGHAVAEEDDGHAGCTGSDAALPRAAHLPHEAALEHREDCRMCPHSSLGRLVHRVPAYRCRQQCRPNGAGLLRRVVPYLCALHLCIFPQALAHNALLGARVAVVELGEERVFLEFRLRARRRVLLPHCAIDIGALGFEPVRPAGAGLGEGPAERIDARQGRQRHAACRAERAERAELSRRSRRRVRLRAGCIRDQQLERSRGFQQRMVH
mmetsp:Transcript_65324/g.188121  ORF Transcript_65324/g.188121 Transcript_65324/m.188121 type:complete len:217 (-) Transcript_65324:1448-2098(-)